MISELFWRDKVSKPIKSLKCDVNGEFYIEQQKTVWIISLYVRSFLYANTQVPNMMGQIKLGWMRQSFQT